VVKSGKSIRPSAKSATDNMWLRKVLLDFIIGGFLVAGALLIATAIGPVYGGVIAGAPIRAGTTAVLAGTRDGVGEATGIAKGMVFSMVANVFFALVLFLTLPRIGLWKAMLLASAVFLVLVTVLMKVSP